MTFWNIFWFFDTWNIFWRTFVSHHTFRPWFLWLNHWILGAVPWCWATSKPCRRSRPRPSSSRLPCWKKYLYNLHNEPHKMRQGFITDHGCHYMHARVYIYIIIYNYNHNIYIHIYICLICRLSEVSCRVMPAAASCSGLPSGSPKLVPPRAICSPPK